MTPPSWAVITDDEWLCFGFFADEEHAAKAATAISRMYGLGARCVHIQHWRWRDYERWLTEEKVEA